MRELHSFLELAVRFGEVALAEHEADKHALHKVARMVEKRAKEKIGEYQDQAGPFAGWAELADATKEDRARQGFPEDEPLLRTGDLRDSIEHQVHDNLAEIGSNSDIAVYQELGTAKIPPRSFLGGAAAEKIEKIKQIMGESAYAALIGKDVHTGRMEIEQGMEAYKVGVTIALTNKISQGLLLIQRDLKKTDAQAVALHSTLTRISKLAISGAILGGVGYALMKPLEAGYEAAKKYEQALNQFKSLNLGDAVNKDADKFARGSSVIGASATDLIHTVRDLHTALGDYGMAKSLAPQIAQMKFANQAVFGEHGMDMSDRQLQAMEKIIEMKGGFKSPEAFMAQADMMQKVIAGTGGMVKPSDYLQFIKTAGVSGRLLSNEAFYYTMEPLIQEMSGGRVGTGLMSGYNNLAQGRSTVRAAKEMMRLGIVDPSMVEWTKIGTVKRILPGALKGMDEYTSNPYQWMKDVLIPAMAAKGITSETAILNEMGAIYGNRTGSNLFSLMYLQQSKIEKNMAISKNAMDTQQLLKLAKSSPQGAEMALGAAWESLKIAAGEVLIPIVIPALLKLADGIRELGQMINRHPIRFEALIYGFAGLSTALMFSGAVLTLKAAFIGIQAVMGVTGLTGAVGAMSSAITLTALPALALLTAAIGSIVYHKEIAAFLDRHAPGVGDALMSTRDFLSGTAASNGNRGFSPPSSGGRTIQVNSTINLDGRPVAQAVTQHQYDGMNASPASGGGFDGRQSFTAPAYNPFAP